MSVAAQNFANLQAVTQQLRQELMSQTRELQENKLRFARHENQVAEERESIHREFHKNKEESLDFLTNLFARELDSRDQKADEKVARVRQLRKSGKFKYDLEIYDRAKEGTYNHTYQFLTQSLRDLLTRERIRRNRDKIARSHGDKYGAPAPDDR